MLETKGDSFKGKTVVVSGSGNVAVCYWKNNSIR
jgi:glutamate dehydrogenase/leucine dehydrogenase